MSEDSDPYATGFDIQHEDICKVLLFAMIRLKDSRASKKYLVWLNK